MNEQKLARPAQKLKTEKAIIITGILTSRIETRNKNNEIYYYGFFKLANQTQEIPVIFKVKPDLKRGSSIELEGNWAKSNHSRPSFTCQAYQVFKDPPASQVQINCFYNSQFSPCAFTTPESQLMEKHYRQEHYLKSKEVYLG